MTRDQALALAQTRFWEDMTLREQATFQLYEPLLCMPFSQFHEAMEKTLGRLVYTHEFVNMEGLKAELNGDKPAPTLQEILALIPAEKRVFL